MLAFSRNWSYPSTIFSSFVWPNASYRHVCELRNTGHRTRFCLRALLFDCNSIVGLFARSFAFAILVVVGLCAWSVYRFGSLETGLRYGLHGERLFVSPQVIDLGDLPRDGERVAEISIANHSHSPVQLFGAGTRCSCVEVEQLPLSIAAGESRRVNIRISGVSAGIGRQRTEFSQIVELHTDSPVRRTLHVNIRATLVAVEPDRLSLLSSH
jgi:hypothetical protein